MKLPTILPEHLRPNFQKYFNPANFKASRRRLFGFDPKKSRFNPKFAASAQIVTRQRIRREMFEREFVAARKLDLPRKNRRRIALERMHSAWKEMKAAA